ncbi:hypothetical protein [Jeotgalibacillus soli]|uniref:Uncharacterized protein n=1 Tax=Jeotgalibacillus soli TaxID=889306 RepID=A0A0C2S6B4_9BACL|nr:hypothetical protein [Jeotgalibacillus soli]KIL49554.1 hypothetical protein KP78_10220 [Jeotgalibacillus soli]
MTLRLKRPVKHGLYIIGAAITAIIVINGYFSSPSYQSEALHTYLEKEIAWKNHNGVITDAFKIYGSTDDELYLWYLFEEWDVDNQTVKSAASLPLIIELNNRGEAIGHKIPEDGALYPESMKELFPFHVSVRMPKNGAPSSIVQAVKMQQEDLSREEDIE